MHVENTKLNATVRDFANKVLFHVNFSIRKISYTIFLLRPRRCKSGQETNLANLCRAICGWTFVQKRSYRSSECRKCRNLCQMLLTCIPGRLKQQDAFIIWFTINTTFFSHLPINKTSNKVGYTFFAVINFA